MLWQIPDFEILTWGGEMVGPYRAILSDEFPGLALIYAGPLGGWTVNHSASGVRLCGLDDIYLKSCKDACDCARFAAKEAAKIGHSWTEPQEEIMRWASPIYMAIRRRYPPVFVVDGPIRITEVTCHALER